MPDKPFYVSFIYLFLHENLDASLVMKIESFIRIYTSEMQAFWHLWYTSNAG